VQVQLSFRDRRGAWCRSFTTPAEAGLACRDADHWAVEWLMPAQRDASTGMRQAASTLPPALLQVIETRIDGTPLDANAEQLAIERGWRASATH